MLKGMVLGLAMGALAAFHPGGGLAGYTDWDCRERSPYGWVRSDVLTQDVRQAVAVAVHEEQHVADMRQAGSCAAERLMRVSPAYRLRLEARGFCRTAQAYTRLGLASDSVAFEAVGQALSVGYPFGLSPQEAEARVRAACQDLAQGR